MAWVGRELLSAPLFTYNSGREEANKVVAAVSEAGCKAIALPLDIGNVSAFDPSVKEVNKALGEMGVDRFDFLVNNTGTSHHASFRKRPRRNSTPSTQSTLRACSSSRKSSCRSSTTAGGS